MSVTEISSGLVLRDKKLLMVFDEDEEVWHVPSVEDVTDRIGANAVEDAVSEFTGRSSEVTRYKDRLKSRFSVEGIEVVWQPYLVEVDGEPERGEWVPLSEIAEKEFAHGMDEIKSQLAEL